MAGELSRATRLSVGDVVWVPQLSDATYLVNDVGDWPPFVQQIVLDESGRERLAGAGTLPERIDTFYVLGHWTLEHTLSCPVTSTLGRANPRVIEIIEQRYKQPPREL